MKEFKLACGATVLLDDEDYERIPKTGYLLDERSTTIERILLEEENPNMEEILGINFKEIFE